MINGDIDESSFPVNRNLFIERYGAYLQIQSCLSFASLLKDETATTLILEVAKYDPNHRDAYKEMQNANRSLFYDQVSSKLFERKHAVECYLLCRLIFCCFRR